MIIGISGYIGSGKDTVAKMIQDCIIRTKRYDAGIRKYDEEYINRLLPEGREFCSGWEIKKFAGKLKQIVSLLTGIPAGDLERQDVKDRELGTEWTIGNHIPADTYWRDMKQNKDWIPPFCINCKSITKPNYYVCDNCLASRKSEWLKLHGPETHVMTVRELLQRLGTDAMRDKVHPNIHVNALFADYNIGERTSIKLNDFGGIIPDQKPNWIISDLRFPNEAEAIKARGGFIVRVNRVEPAKEGPEMVRHISETALDKQDFDWVIENDGTLDDLLGQVAVMLKESSLKLIP